MDSIPSRANDHYEKFRDSVRNTLLAVAVPMTWTEIRAKAEFKQKFPNNRWVRRMENDIGLVRTKRKGGGTLWKIEEGGTN